MDHGFNGKPPRCVENYVLDRMSDAAVLYASYEICGDDEFAGKVNIAAYSLETYYDALLLCANSKELSGIMLLLETRKHMIEWKKLGCDEEMKRRLKERKPDILAKLSKMQDQKEQQLIIDKLKIKIDLLGNVSPK